MRLTVNIANKTMREIRQDLFTKFQSLSIKYFDSHTHGELMSRLTNDVDNIGQVLNQSLVQLISCILTVIMTISVMLMINPLLTLVALVIVPASILLTKKIAKHSRLHFSNQQKSLGELNGLIEETISGQKVVKVFGREKIIIEKFAEKNDELKDAGMMAQFLAGMMGPTMNSLNNLSYSLVALTGGWMLISGSTTLTIGKVSNMLIYSRQLARPINEIASLFNTLQSAIAGAERVFEIMEERPEPSEGKIIKKESIKGKVEFKNVTFAYKEGENVLKNVSIVTEPGSTIALVGPTGAGKTTIVNLLTRFYDVNEGAILIDGEDIRILNRQALRQSLGMVLQDTYLFSASIRENIRYGRLDATDEEVEQAARLSNIHKFISHLPDGYDTVLSDGGEGISQGQRQLISIARTMLADPAILILDEATSSIDTRTEKHIQEALLKLMCGRTSFVIAHRLSTIRDADEILVINDGQIIEKGSHDSLYNRKGFYYNLYSSQFKIAAG
jgi:ATP-binding cassette subfamily B multidrug efflux pump